VPSAVRADGQGMNASDRPNPQLVPDNPAADLLLFAQATVGLAAVVTALLAVVGVA